VATTLRLFVGHYFAWLTNMGAENNMNVTMSYCKIVGTIHLVENWNIKIEVPPVHVNILLADFFGTALVPPTTFSHCK